MSVASPLLHRTPTLSASAEAGVEAKLGHLREQFIHSRADRGPCPPFSRLKADFLPVAGPRDGVEERREHLRLCVVCGGRVSAWKRSWQFVAEQSLAWSGIAAHHAGRYSGSAARTVTRRLGRAASATYRSTRSLRPAARRRRAALPPLVVLEAGPGLPPPQDLAAEVEARGGGLVVVPRIEEALRDPDWRFVRTAVLARPRPFGEWREALQRIEGPDRSRCVFAVLPPALGPAAGALRGDPRVLAAPLTPAGWGRLLAEAGWGLPTATS